MQQQYNYLIQEREFIKSGECIYKIGQTRQEHNKRFYGYPKGSIILLQLVCSDCIACEKEIKKKFISKYIHRKDIGTEYFEGDAKIMMKDICSIVESYGNIPFQTNKKNKNLLDEKNENKIIEISKKFQEFIEESLIKTENPNDILLMVNIWFKMRDWYECNYDEKCPPQKELRTYIQQNMASCYDPKKDSLICYKIKLYENFIG